MSSRTVLLVVHTGRRSAVSAARELTDRLTQAGLAVRVLAEETDAIARDTVTAVPANCDAAVGAELVIALGGDGTILRAAELARPAAAALLGVNLGHVGFLAEAERTDLEVMVGRILAKSYDVEERLTLDVVVRRGGQVLSRDWALNDVTIEKTARQRMLELMVEVDGRPLSRWSGDGLVCATPTGSTAYAFSAGGPVVWPSVQAMLLVPISAHALFARPLVVGPESRLAVELLTETGGAIAFCDGRRTTELAVRDRVEIGRGQLPVRLVRLSGATFTDRLVGKFRLPVRGWRGHTEEDRAED
ncbi:MAG: kinase [Frankiaceae bacterium]|jgi:NAD+ kinase|nr:kinase [Frankiaceae bacterium]